MYMLDVYSCLMFINFILLDITIVETVSIQNLALAQNGTSCLIGTYSPIIDTRCTPAIDGSYHRYNTPAGNGWIQITLPSLARVTVVDLAVARHNQAINHPIPIRIIFNDGEYKVVLLKQPDQFIQESYRQRVVLGTAVLTKSVTLAWTTVEMPPIVDISIFGSTEGISEIDATVVTCDDSISMCMTALDGNILTSTSIYSNNSITLQMAAQSNQDLSYAVFYSHPQSGESETVPIRMKMLDSMENVRGTLELIYENQGWGNAGAWQILALSSYRLSPTWLVIQATDKPIVLSEIHLYHVNPGIELYPREVPYVQLLPDEHQYIYNCQPKYFGENPSTPSAESTTLSVNRPIPTTLNIMNPTTTTTGVNIMTPSTTTPVHHDNSTAEQGHIMTERPPMRFTTGPDLINEFTVVIAEEIEHKPTDELSDQDTMNDDEYSLPPVFDALNNTNNNATTSHIFLGIDWASLPWYWYVLIGVGVFTLILVIIIVVLILRMKKRQYSPNPRPRIVLRSVRLSSGGDDAVSVVTPTRGYYQLTFNSQSSLPTPYTAVSGTNTTTFGLNKERELRNSHIYRYQPSHEMDKSETNSDDLELSDDCFRP